MRAGSHTGTCFEVSARSIAARDAARTNSLPAAGQRASVLLHREQRHVVCGAVVETHPRLRVAHRVGERPAARNQHDAPGLRGDRLDPILQMRREGVAAAQLDHREVATAHSLSAFGSLSAAATGNR